MKKNDKAIFGAFVFGFWNTFISPV